jgi:hypothetical protein
MPILERSKDLERELQTYKAKLPELLADEGKFVLIYGKQIIDVFGTYEDAIKAGYEQFELQPFLVKQIHAMEEVQFVTRLSVPCLI